MLLSLLLIFLREDHHLLASSFRIFTHLGSGQQSLNFFSRERLRAVPSARNHHCRCLARTTGRSSGYWCMSFFCLWCGVVDRRLRCPRCRDSRHLMLFRLSRRSISTLCQSVGVKWNSCLLCSWSYMSEMPAFSLFWGLHLELSRYSTWPLWAATWACWSTLETR